MSLLLETAAAATVPSWVMGALALAVLLGRLSGTDDIVVGMRPSDFLRDRLLKGSVLGLERFDGFFGCFKR